MGLFITFEGVEGSGKTTQIERLKKYLSGKGIPSVVTREPGGSPIGERVRKILLDPGSSGMDPMTELLLYEASRVQHVKKVIEPLLADGKVVLCDRFADASIAYQGYGRGVDLKSIRGLNRLAMGKTRPDLTFLLDCPSRLGLKRAVQRNQLRSKGEDRFEREALHFHKRVRQGYLSLAEREPRRVKLIDTRKGEEKVFEQIRKIVDDVIARRISDV